MTDGKESNRRNCERISDEIREKNTVSNPKFYVDDGYTGTNFDRPSFKCRRWATEKRACKNGHCQRLITLRQELY